MAHPTGNKQELENQLQQNNKKKKLLTNYTIELDLIKFNLKLTNS